MNKAATPLRIDIEEIVCKENGKKTINYEQTIELSIDVVICSSE